MESIQSFPGRVGFQEFSDFHRGEGVLSGKALVKKAQESFVPRPDNTPRGFRRREQ